MSGWLGQLIGGLRGLFVWWYVVTPWEDSLRVRLGKRVQRLGAGIHFRIPFVDRVYRQSVRLRISDLPIQTLTTKDGRALVMKGQVSYEITDIERLYSTIHEGEGAVDNLVRGAIAAFVCQSTSAECLPPIIEAAAQEGIDLAAYGLRLARVQVTDFAYVKTYRLITQDVWSVTNGRLDTNMDDDHKRQNGIAA